jgi:hypothetical protein
MVRDGILWNFERLIYKRYTNSFSEALVSKGDFWLELFEEKFRKELHGAISEQQFAALLMRFLEIFEYTKYQRSLVFS